MGLKGVSSIDSTKIKQAIEAVQAKASELNTLVSVAIVDEYGDLVAFSRMSGAIKISPKFAITKAYTSGTLGMATSDMAAYATEGKPYHGIDSIFSGSLTTIAGGLPIKDKEKLVGGIGVGGSLDVNQDVECAKAGLDAILG